MEQKTKRIKRHRLVALVLLSGWCLFLVIRSFFLAPFRVVRETVATDSVSGFRIALVTDLHSCWYGSDMHYLLDALRREKPDIVLLGGDIYHDDTEFGETGKALSNADIFLQAVGKEFTCYYVSGNHEYWSGHAEEMKQVIEGYGIEVLEGESQEILCADGSRFLLSGIDDYDAGESEIAQQLERIRENQEAAPELFHILLAHHPERIEEYAAYGFDLVLSGHAHGGQWVIPGILNGLYAPDQGFFPEYAGGRYTVENTIMIVSRGLARLKPFVPRIFNRQELVMIELVAE